MFSCQVCGRISKSKETIDKCKHSRLKSKTEKNDPENPINLLDENQKTLNEIVLNDNQNIDTIFHCSDIHIRLNKRHNEYLEVFSNFYKMLNEKKKEKPNSLIVCCGDILHQKLDLSPEAIIMVLDFLENLAKIFPTIIIAGNHDALLTNNQRQDSLTGILYNRTINNLWYLKESGIYRYGNLVFGVSSLLDNQFISAKQIPDSNLTKIGLYHGAVGCPVNMEGFKLSADKKIQDFSGYDIVLLGDIHMYQYLNEEKTIAYSSSLISQNFGETDSNHGFLEWDIPTRTSIYNIVENPYRYVSYDYQIGMENTLLELDLPNKCHLRIRVPKELELTNKNLIITIDNLEKELRKKYPEITLNILWIPKETNLLGNESINMEKMDILSKLEEYIENLNGEILEEDKKWLIENINIEENNKPIIQWELIEMKWDYLCKYTNGNIFDFRKLDKTGLNGIIASNSAGKSSLLDILCFLLFGSMTRNISNRKHIQPDIVNIHHNKGYGEIYFRVFPNNYYKIEKTCNRTKDNSIKVTSSIWKLEENSNGDYEWDDKKWTKINLSGKDRIENDKIVEELIGNFEDFLNGSISLQFDNKSFRSMAPKARKEYLLRIFHLEQFINQYDPVRKKFIELDALTTNLREKQIVIDINEISGNLGELKQKKLSITIEIDSKILKIKELRENYEKLLLEINNDQVENYDQLIKEQIRYLIEIEEITKWISNFNYDEIVEKIKTNEIQENDYKEQIEILRSNKESLSNFDNQISEDEYMDISKEIDNYGDITMIDYKIGELKSMIIEKPNRVTRERVIIENELLGFKEKLEINTKRLEEINKEIGKIQEEISGFNLIENQYKENQKKKDEIDSIKDQTENWRNAISDLEKNHEFNPDCHICMKNNNTKRLLNYKKTLLGLEEKLKDIIVNFEIELTYKEQLKKKNLIEGLLGEREVLYKKIDKYRNKVQENHKELEDCSLYERYLEGKKKQEELREIEGLRERIRKWEEYKRNIEIIKKNKLIEDRNRLIEEEITMVKGELLVIQEEIKNDRKFLNQFQEKKNRQEILIMKRIVLEEKIERAKKQLENKKLEEEARLIKNQIEIENNELKMEEKELVNIEKKIFEMEGKLEEYEKNKDELGVKLVERNRYSMLKEILSPKGFSLWLLEDYLKEMSKGITGILWEMIKLRFEIRIVDNDIMIYSYRGNGDNSEGIRLDMYGGMESFLIDLSFKIVMMEMSKIPKCLFLLIDEGIAAFDNNNLSNLENLWGLLGNIYHNVILITHIDKCKDYLTNIISINTDINEKYSKIVF